MSANNTTAELFPEFEETTLQDDDVYAVWLLTGLQEPLTYALPEGVLEPLAVGHLVEAPLAGRTCLGVVAKKMPRTAYTGPRLKRMLRTLHPFPVMTPQTVELCVWLARYYAAPMASVLECALPAAVRESFAPKMHTFIALAQPPPSSQVIAKLARRAPAQAKVLQYLLAQPKPAAALERPGVLEATGASPSVLEGLLKKSLITQTQEASAREAYTETNAESSSESSAEGSAPSKPAAPALELNPEQAAAAEAFCTDIRAGGFHTHLLHGVTGSGKTEVFLAAMEAALDTGGSVLYLVPEVALTPQTLQRVRQRLAQRGETAWLWHSHLSHGQRADAWAAMAQGTARVVVGARSALFAPLKNLKCIIVDEEHEPAYKQAEVPRYHGRDVAVYRAHLSGATCILGSATPSLETLHNANTGRYKLQRLTQRVDSRQLPRMRIIDMKPEIMQQASKARKAGGAKGGGQGGSGSGTIFSKALLNALQQRLENREQSILFLNRRGYAARLLCPSCGHVPEAPDSSLSLTYHQTTNQLRCHLTGYTEKVPSKCPKCSHAPMVKSGTGTQKVEEVLAKCLPQAKFERIDADTMGSKHRFRDILGRFRQRKIDILLGTQMIAKGLDFPGVTLVGVLDADLSLHVPDFRAAERTFQLLVQVAGRAGRGHSPGEVLVQTFSPHAAPIQYAKRAEFDAFLQAELAARAEFGYPPHSHLVRHLFRGEDEAAVAARADAFAEYAEAHLPESILNTIQIKGPAPAPIERLRGAWRQQLWYFCPKPTQLVPHLQHLRAAFLKSYGARAEEVIDLLDVDPVDLM